MVNLVPLAHGVFGNLDELLGMIGIGILTITLGVVWFATRNQKDTPSDSAAQVTIENIETQPDSVIPETAEHYRLD